MTSPIVAPTAGTPLDASSRIASDANAASSASSDKTAHATTPKPAVSSTPAATASPPTSLTQLVVTPGKGAEPYIYKLVDRSTGEVLSEMPREVANNLAATPSYTVGTVVDESA